MFTCGHDRDFPRQQINFNLISPRVFLLCHFSSNRELQSNSVYFKETQKQQETSHALHYLPAAGAGAQVSPEAVPLHRRESRVLQLSQPDGDPGQNMVSEQESESQETAGGRAGEVQTGLEARPARLRATVPPRSAHGVPDMGPVERLPEAQSAGPRTVQWTRHLWDVLFVLVLQRVHVCVFLKRKMSSVMVAIHLRARMMSFSTSRETFYVFRFGEKLSDLQDKKKSGHILNT